ncbi:Transposase and inactivated derivatives, IS30 family [Eubacterium uniforme]|uniref:Transposase and inactivated derivatives, IS30 family n=2 Tax=Eubacterium uniforme TaxID=39495 RepID=A0A1T4W7E7_9FIRM|nr:IS30 family transposase [Eubacterium uniforme]SKA73039.1 Transposase and inactivated derivatives, IS30 family [Eubacterium uniforme]
MQQSKTKRPYRHLNKEDRIRIETLYNNGHSGREISKILGFNQSTICRELKKGMYEHTNSDLTTTYKYSYNKAQEITEINVSKRGPKYLKIDKQKEYAEFIEKDIVENKHSPEVALVEAKKAGFKFHISVRTLYNYIDMDLFTGISLSNLPVKRKRNKRSISVTKYKTLKKEAPLITDRPEEVEDRKIFGHWEMDTVKGRKGVTKGCLLVLTERKTRKEIIRFLKNQKSESVVKELNEIEKIFGEKFSDIFKSITVDNGSEFSDYENMKKSAIHEGDRVEIYYCHPYSSWERGSNENGNRFIRRIIPKGKDFDKITSDKVNKIEYWMNNYPRRMFGFKTAEELYQKELRKLAS